MKKLIVFVVVVCTVLLSACGMSKTDNALFKDGLLPVKQGGEWGYINNKDKFIIEPQYISCTIFSEGLAAVQTEYGKWGYINKKGNFVIEPFECHTAGVFKDGMAAVKVKTEYKNCYGFIDKKGEFIIEPKYDYVDSIGEDGVARISITDSGGLGHYGIVNSEGQIVIDTYSDDEFGYINPFSEGMAAARKEGKLWGYINTQGNFVIEERFDIADEFSEGLACVGVRNDEDIIMYGYINTKGEFVIEPIFESGSAFKEGVARVKVEDKWCYIATDGNVLKEMDYHFVSDFSADYARVDLSDGFLDLGYINKDFDNVIDCKYAYAEDFKDDGYTVVADESKKYYVIDKSGKAITKPYDKVGFLAYDFCQEKDCYMSGQYMSTENFKLYCYKHKKD